MATEQSASNPGDATQTPASPVPLPTVEAEGLQPIYANFVKVTPAPEELVLGVIKRLREIGPVDVVPMHGVEETIEFRLPPELREPSDDLEVA